MVCFPARGATINSRTIHPDPTLTRRDVLQGVAGLTAASLLRAESKHAQKQSAWPSDDELATILKNRLLPFTSDWRFHRGDITGAEAPSFDDSAWRTLDVPHDWSIEDLPSPSDSGEAAIWSEGTNPLRIGPFDAYQSEGQIATGWTVGGIGWYRKSFQAPSPKPGRAELRFEGVYMNSGVWINGTHLGNHPYGYTPFAYDLTPHLKEGTNVIAVRVNNTGKNSRWYSGSGIFRKVWLAINSDLRIPEYGVSITTPEASKAVATVNIAVTVENASAAARRAIARVRLLDASGATAAESQSPLTIPASNTASATCELHVSNPHLWSPANPHLYRAEILIESDRKPGDATTLNIGIRKIEIDAAQGLRINGEPLKLQGGCVHHDNGPLGAACIPRAEERRVEILKANGYNAIRTSHNPPSRDFLDACDRLGMLVIDEAFDCWEAGNKNPQDYHLYFKDWWQRDLESMILRDRNHPSVILWSIGNEINERAEPHGVEIGKALAALCHKLDPTRKVTAAICHAWDHPGQTWADMQPAFTYLDVGGYNYQWPQYEKDHAKYPDRTMAGTESFPNQAYENWRAVEANSYVLGDFVWTAIDYLGESGIGHASIASGQSHDVFSPPYPWFNSYCGDIDLIGNKKPQSYFRDVVWHRSKIEMAVQRPIPTGYTEHISMWGWSDELRSWTWPGFENTPMHVRVYTRGDKVRLLLNDKEVGSKNLTENDALKAEFTVPYAPGELKAIGYEGDRELGTVSFGTTGTAHKLLLTPDKPKLTASRDELSYVMVQIVDEQGRPLPDAVVPVTFTLTGSAEIAAVASANPKDVASFRQPHHRTFHGACVAIIRPKGNAGTAELRAESPDLQPATTTLEITA
ncbi:glycoside hydrolase family 2 TIM barrel-domain containing protein [Occallatibacter savannae]|uniref:glycoside hydrolase family 2 TIM barrel-domain containing protein n=1 Tax=Occallatibacter savannae TaxID=1002691 RepID=UPI000D68E358|nr:glycoside hydrolase family 2 TIM barrel-domain containing protein [Occallatibacter savannae]